MDKDEAKKVGTQENMWSKENVEEVILAQETPEFVAAYNAAKPPFSSLIALAGENDEHIGSVCRAFATTVGVYTAKHHAESGIDLFSKLASILAQTKTMNAILFVQKSPFADPMVSVIECAVVDAINVGGVDLGSAVIIGPDPESDDERLMVAATRVMKRVGFGLAPIFGDNVAPVADAMVGAALSLAVTTGGLDALEDFHKKINETVDRAKKALPNIMGRA